MLSRSEAAALLPIDRVRSLGQPQWWLDPEPGALPGLGGVVGFKGLQFGEYAIDHLLLAGEQRIGTTGMPMGKGWFVESSPPANLSRRQLVDDHLDKANLRGA